MEFSESKFLEYLKSVDTGLNPKLPIKGKLSGKNPLPNHSHLYRRHSNKMAAVSLL